MFITAIETVHLARLPRLAFVTVRADDGSTGVGETYDKALTAIAAVHEVVAPLVLGRDPFAIGGLSHRVRDQIQFHGRSGAELRAWSAVEMALFDLAGKAAGLPVHRLLGGRCRDAVPVYNTCVGHGGIDDHTRFERDPAGLAAELLTDGFALAKVWPFDRASERYLGQRLDDRDLAGGVAVVAAMRSAGMQVGVELHGRWTLSAAARIAAALEPHDPAFLEEALPATSPEQLAALRRRTRIPLVGSEWLLSRADVLTWLRADATDILMTDPSWNGGLLESVRIAALAESFGLPLVFHSCGGPLTHAAAMQLALVVPNLYAVETVRSFQRTYFRELSDVGLTVRDGLATPDADRPGLGVELADLTARDDATVQLSVTDSPAPPGFGLGDCWDDPAWSGAATDG